MSSRWNGDATRYFALGAAAVLIGLSSTASAAIVQIFWRPNVISPAAISNDPTGQLGGMQSWSLMVEFDSGFWASAALRATLPPGAGNFYWRHPLDGDFRPNNAQISANPSRAFSTYVTQLRSGGATTGNPVILGAFPEGSLPKASFGLQNSQFPGLFAVSWGDPQAVNGPPGPLTIEIARLTFPQAVLPEIHPLSQASTVNPADTQTIPQIPEPAAGLCVAAMAAMVALRRRRIS